MFRGMAESKLGDLYLIVGTSRADEHFDRLNEQAFQR